MIKWSGSVPVPLTNGSGSGRPKTSWSGSATLGRGIPVQEGSSENPDICNKIKNSYRYLPSKYSGSLLLLKIKVVCYSWIRGEPWRSHLTFHPPTILLPSGTNTATSLFTAIQVTRHNQCRPYLIRPYRTYYKTGGFPKKYVVNIAKFNYVLYKFASTSFFMYRFAESWLKVLKQDYHTKNVCIL